jgi:beta-1,4-mannosyltransferase
VLGDLGRSPRMQYHALALAENRLEVDVVAYSGSAPVPALAAHPRIRLHLLAAPRQGLDPARPARSALIALHLCRQALRLLWLLGRGLPKPDVILVQNPPAVPTLLVALIAARARSARLVIDWHNFGYSMLTLKLPAQSMFVRLARWYERTVGRRADRHLCVSQAMRAELAEHWRIPGAIVLYDRPAAQFTPTPPAVGLDFCRRISAQAGLRCEGDQRPALIVYPTSWTADEDYGLLLEAAIKCDEKISRHDQNAPQRPFPHVLIAITGRGPLREHYEKEIARLGLKKVHLRTLWLSPEDYPLMLGAADLGLCCHRSSSGFDLPMKIADMMGAGLPVLALNYGGCLAEQVRDGETGLLFADAEQLATQLYEIFREYPAAPRLKRLRDNVQSLRPMRWAEGWKLEAGPIFALA